MLVHSPRLDDTDIETWKRYESVDFFYSKTRVFNAHVAKAKETLHDFVRRGGGYTGVSWGKDSVVVVGLMEEAGIEWPLVWVRIRPIENPECVLVRDVFFERFPAARQRYSEIEVWCRHDSDGWHATGTLERGLADAAKEYGGRYVSGIRGEESASRNLRTARYGTTTERTCAPISFWTGQDVFAYLHARNLPVHPAYAMSHRGLLERGRIRVASLGGQRGTGMGRDEWERHYYQDERFALDRGLVPSPLVAPSPVEFRRGPVSPRSQDESM